MSFRKYILDEKMKGGNGYIENILNNENSMYLDKFINSVNEFIYNSEDYADEEGISVKKQKKLIIDDVLAYISNKLK